jgi:hypothetical protein
MEKVGGEMKIIPLTLKEANELVEKLHRHHKPVRGHRFSIGVLDNGKIVGAAIVGRPVARNTDWHTTAEVTRLVTDGTKNACSILYAACARICENMGFESIQTFILDSEPGISLLAAGWGFVFNTSGGTGWNNRIGRRNDQPICPKQKFEKRFYKVKTEDEERRNQLAKIYPIVEQV